MAQQDKNEERKFLLECIELYKQLPALWQVKSKDYSNKSKKEAAYEELLEKYKERYEMATKNDLKKKFNSLRTNFRKELKKINKSLKSGAGTEEVYETNLWYYDAMLFLEDQETPVASTSTIDGGADEPIHSGSDEDQREDDSIDDQPNTTFSSQKKSRGGKRSKTITERRDELMSLACKKLREPTNEYFDLAKTWSHEISQMETQQQLLAKKAINDILFEGRMGTLTRTSVQINAVEMTTRSSTPLGALDQQSYQSSTSTYTPIAPPMYCASDQNHLANYFSSYQP